MHIQLLYCIFYKQHRKFSLYSYLNNVIRISYTNIIDKIFKLETHFCYNNSNLATWNNFGSSWDILNWEINDFYQQ